MGALIPKYVGPRYVSNRKFVNTTSTFPELTNYITSHVHYLKENHI